MYIDIWSTVTNKRQEAHKYGKMLRAHRTCAMQDVLPNFTYMQTPADPNLEFASVSQKQEN